MARKSSRRSRGLSAKLFAGAVVGWAALLGAASCGDSIDESLVSPCAELGNKCGGSCTGVGDCPAGTHCSEGKCTAECTPGKSHCNAGEICDGATGRCTILIGDGGGGTGPGDGAVGDGCINAKITFEKQIPTVVLLIDQSGSMTESFGGGTRWSVVHSALMDPTTGIVKLLENEVRFGLALYTGDGGNGVCPTLTEVSTSLGNYAAIKTVYDAAQPENETPTGESIDEVVTTLVPYPEPGPKVIVLATDGEPDTCAVPNPQNGQPEAVKAAQDAFAAGIETYVISVGNGISLNHLQDMANAGKGTPVGGSQNEPYYQALDQQALYDAFQTIIYGVRPCKLKLNGTVDPANAGQGQVWLDGKPLGHNDPNGWKLNGNDEIELLGTACDAIKSGDHEIQIQFPCGIFQPPS